MKLEIFDPPLCCSSGVCGPNPDRRLIAIVDALKRIADKFQTVEVVRYNLNGQGMAFRDNAAVMDLMQEEGAEVLPIVVCNGRVMKKGAYPSYAELEGYVGEGTT